MFQFLVKIFSVLVTISMTAAVHAHAELMKLDFKGSITSISPYYASPGINLGDYVTGELVFDSATPDGQPLAWMGYYEDAIKDFTLIIGDKNFPMLSPPNSSEIDIINDELVYDNYHDYILFRVAVIDQTFQVSRFFQLTFSQTAAIPPTVLINDALTTSININDFEIKTGFLTYMPPGASEGNNITLTYVELYPVPIQTLDGDIDGDLTVNLPDAILGLQVIANMNLASKVYTSADVNGDRKIGLEEVIYVLQFTSGMRPQP